MQVIFVVLLEYDFSGVGGRLPNTPLLLQCLRARRLERNFSSSTGSHWK